MLNWSKLILSSENRDLGGVEDTNYALVVEELPMGDLFWLTDKQMQRIEPYFPLSHGVPRVDDFNEQARAWERYGDACEAVTHIITTHKDSDGREIRRLEYDMEAYFRKCLDKWTELTGQNWHQLPHVKTPFLDEDQII